MFEKPVSKIMEYIIALSCIKKLDTKKCKENYIVGLKISINEELVHQV